MAVARSNEPQAFLAFEQDAWNEVIGAYERLFAPLTAQAVEPLLAAARVRAGARLLDVCTGHGGIAAAAAARGAEACGLDFSAEAVAIARRNVPAADFNQGDTQELPYPDETFDCVTCGYGLMHLPEPDRALLEMRRVLKPGGRLAISVWQAPAAGNGYGLLFGALKAHGRMDVPLPHGPNFFQFSDPATLPDILRQAGFNDVGVTGVEQFWEMQRASDLLGAMLQGAVRYRALLMAQKPDALAAIKADVDAGMDRVFRVGEAYRVPMPALIGSGAKR